MSAAFLPFLRKEPIPAPKPIKNQEEEDPLALPLPSTKSISQLGTASSKFITKLNGKRAAAKPGVSHAVGRTALAPSKSSSTPGTTKLGATATVAHKSASANKAAVGKHVPAKVVTSKGAPASKPVPLTPAQAKAEAEKRRLKQLERLAALGALAPKDAPPEVLAKYEQAKQQAAEIKRQQALAAKRKVEEEQRRRQLELRRQQQEQERLRLLEEKQRMRTGKPGLTAARPITPPAAGAAGPGRGPPSAAAGGRSLAAGTKAYGPPVQSAAGSMRMPVASSSQQQQQQHQKDPYANLNPKQRAFLLARKREREGRMNGRGDFTRGGSADVDELYEDEYDELDDFIDDDEEGDWRAQLRAMTGYDPRKYQDSFWDDRKMEASAAEIAAEERRSARMGRAEDEREAEAEARRLAAKEAKKSGRKKGAAAMFDD